MFSLLSLGSASMALGCPDCPPPPSLDWRPPPDPTAFFADLHIPWDDEDREYAQCSIWESEGLGESLTGSPLAFVVAAIALFVLLTVSASLVVLCFKRRRKSLEKSTGSSLMSSKSSGDTPHAAILPDTADPHWSYSGLSRPPSHQNSRSNFGVFLYGDGAESMRSYRESLSRQHPHPQPGFATQGRPTRALPLQSTPSLHHHTTSRPGIVREAPVYEEIPGRPTFLAASLDHLQHDPRHPHDHLQHHHHLHSTPQHLHQPSQTQPRRGRCPPPSVKPPPPPVMVDAGAGSPLSSGSCSCSATTGSLDQEMEAIRVTPSPRRASRSGHSRDSLGGSGERAPDWADGSSSSGGGGGAGRESGYGTDKRRRGHRSASGMRPPLPVTDSRTAILAASQNPSHSMTYV